MSLDYDPGPPPDLDDEPPAPVEHVSRVDDAQRLLLGAFLSDPSVIEPCLTEAHLRPEHATPRFRPAIEAAIALFEEGVREIDAFIVAERMRVRPDAVRSLAARPPAHGDPLRYARVVVEEARWRGRETRLVDAARAVSARDEEAFERALEPTESESTGITVLSPEETGQLATSYLSGEEQFTGVPMFLHGLRRGLPGELLLAGEVTVLSGFSSTGKSVVGLQEADFVAQQGGKVCVYTNEMPERDVTLRLLAGASGVPFSRLRSRELRKEDMTPLARAHAKLAVSIAPTFGVSAREIARTIRRRKDDLCVIDLFNRLPGRGSVPEATEIVDVICDAAALSNTHVILIAQLGKKEKGSKRLPNSNDLRETGALYTHPANVLFVHRFEEEVKVGEREEKQVERQLEGLIYFDKLRNGAVDLSRASVRLDERRMRFESVLETP